MSFQEKIIKETKEYSGKTFETCDYYLNQINDKNKFVDIIIKQPMWLSNEFDILTNFAKVNGLESEYAGYNRVRIYNKIT